MKYIKINLAISLLAILMLSLAACAEIPAEAAGVSGEASSYARAAQDTKYSDSTALNGADSNSSHVALKYKGTVDSVTVNTLTLNGQTFSVSTTDDLTTLFTPGSTFEIEFRQNQDGTVSIEQFMAVDDNGEYDVEFKGLVDSVTPSTITLNGETLTAATTDDLTTVFTPGEVYEIKYLFNADGTITIVAFHSEGEDDGSNDDYDVEFKGLVEAVTADTITLNGETFTVAATDDLTTLFTPGEMYEIKFLFNADGTITIVDFHFEDSNDLNDDSSDDNWDNSSDDDSNNNDDDHDNNNDDNNNDDHDRNNNNND